LSTLALGYSVSNHVASLRQWMQEGDAHIKQNWSLMTLRNRIVWVVCDLRSADNMPPVYADFVAGFDGDDFGADGGLEARFAGDVGVIDVAN
jgi:hypothetical protein